MGYAEVACEKDATRAIPVLTAAYVLSQFLRNDIAVIAPEIIRDLALSRQQFGALSSGFFFSFALAQIPLGIFFDVVGVRQPILALLALGAAGAPVFMGLLHDAYARLWVGICCGACLNIALSAGVEPSIALISLWFAVGGIQYSGQAGVSDEA